jgi:hypothetical protein
MAPIPLHSTQPPSTQPNYHLVLDSDKMELPSEQEQEDLELDLDQEDPLINTELPLICSIILM